MKKTKQTAVIAATFAVAMGVASCFPPDKDDDIKVKRKPAEETEITIAIATEYGPPVDYEEPEDVQDVYGPPPDYNKEDDEPVQAVYGPPVDYSESEDS